MTQFPKHKTIIFLGIILAVLLLPEISSAATINATSCSYSDVSSAVGTSTSGDIITVPAGSCTWINQLVITKGIQLIGAGDGVTYGAGTVITSTYSGTNISDSTGYGVVYSPDSSNRTVGFRLSGFEFDFSNLNQGIGIWNKLSNPWNNPVTNVRVDHNILKRGRQEWMVIGGVVYGVADHNIIDHTTGGGDSDAIDHMGIGDNAWRYMEFNFGSGDNWYWEDNTFKAASGYFGDNWDCTDGARYVARFNTIAGTGTAGAMPAFNLHGNGPVNSCMGYELYGNTVGAGSSSHYITTQRGGKGMVWNNNITGSPSSYRAYVNDQGASCTNQGCDNLMTYPVSLISGQPQHVSDSYYFNNKLSGKVSYNYTIDCTMGYDGPGSSANASCAVAYTPYRPVPQENLDVWFHKSSFNGTSGVGVGTLANRPATCTTGVGYWATDQGSWNKTPGGDQGVLYKCTATDMWALYYTPYTYPHPLILAGVPPPDTIPPAAPTGLAVI